jgi:hypothetical protein
MNQRDWKLTLSVWTVYGIVGLKEFFVIQEKTQETDGGCNVQDKVSLCLSLPAVCLHSPSCRHHLFVSVI